MRVFYFFNYLPIFREGLKTIIVTRNPKDTCVSLWHHAREKPEFNLQGGAPRPGSDDPPAPTPVVRERERESVSEQRAGSFAQEITPWVMRRRRKSDPYRYYGI
jgi:hypothetical protein